MPDQFHVAPAPISTTEAERAGLPGSDDVWPTSDFEWGSVWCGVDDHELSGTASHLDLPGSGVSACSWSVSRVLAQFHLGHALSVLSCLECQRSGLTTYRATRSVEDSINLVRVCASYSHTTSLRLRL